MSLWTELKRRNVIRMAGLYVVCAWLVVQVAETLLPIFDTPGWVLKALVVLLAIGFVPALASNDAVCPPSCPETPPARLWALTAIVPAQLHPRSSPSRMC